MKKKKIVLIGIAIFVVICSILGFSYAYWRFTLSQENKNVVVTDCFEITFQGENDISLQKAYPMNRYELETFLQNNPPYHFTITNKCSSLASVGVNLEVLAPASGKVLADQYIDALLVEGTVPIKDIIEDKYNNHYWNIYNSEHNIQYKLTNYPVNSEKVIPEATTAYNMYNFVLDGNSSREFQLYLFLDEETPAISEVMNAQFHAKVTINAGYQQKEEALALLQRSCYYRQGYDATCEDTALSKSNYGKNATKIIIQNELKPIPNAIASYDESYNDDKSVMSYVVENEKANESDATTYTIYLQGKGRISLPPESSYMFYNMSNLTEIEGIEYLDTSNVTNMYQMFYNLNNLTSLDLSNFDTSKVTSMYQMFYGLGSLTSLDVSSFNTSNVTDMCQMFQGMSNLTSLDVSKFDTSKVTSMYSMFNGLSSLTSLDVSNFNTGNVRDIRYMFNNMSALTNLDVSHFNTSNVTYMSYMFSGLSSLTSIDVSNFDTSNVINMTEMFSNMNALTSLDVSNFNTSKVTSMHSMFSYMSALTSLDVSNFDTSKVTSMYSMFFSMSSLTSLNLSNFNTGSVTNMRSMFYGTSKLLNIIYGDKFVYANNADISNMFTNSPANKPLDASWNGIL